MDGKNKTSQQMHSGKESNVAASKLNYIPEALQEVKKHLGHGAAENTMEKIKMTKEKKERQSHDVDGANHKHKSENNKKLSVNKEETMLGTSNQLIPTPLSHIPLKSLIDIEIELVYTDEEDVPFEFSEPEPTRTQSVGHDSEKADALSASNDNALPQIDEQLQMILQEASSCYRQNDYATAVEKLSTALELCSKGTAIDNIFDSFPEDISSIASFIETKLVICYLKLRKPGDALNHSHRSIILNPAYFRNHLRQAAVFRYIKRYSEAARSAMIADYIYWLTGGTEQHTSKLIKLYWQAMFEEAITREVSFSVMYTPFVTEVKADKINKIKDLFAKKHPDYVEHIYTDRKAPFCPVTEEERNAYWINTGKRIMPVIDFIRSTKLTDYRCPCSRGIEKLHYASFLGSLRRVKEQSQVINQAMAELATIPYLQDISQQDAKLLQSLMADAMDTLEGRSHKGRVWNKIQKIGLIEDYLYQAEDNYLRNKRHRKARMERRKMKIQST